MFIIPINTSILYVEPVYLEATNSSIPEVKRIIVAYNDKIAYEETLADCLTSLFGSKAQNGVSGSETTQTGANTDNSGTENLSVREIAELVQDCFTKAQNAQKNGDWAKYGEYLDRMEEYLNELTN